MTASAKWLTQSAVSTSVEVPYSLDDYNYPSDDEGDPFGEIHVHFDAGRQHMDGKTALRYARTRHADNDLLEQTPASDHPRRAAKGNVT